MFTTQIKISINKYENVNLSNRISQEFNQKKNKSCEKWSQNDAKE